MCVKMSQTKRASNRTDCACCSVHVRFGPFSHSVEQNDQNPMQSMFGGHPCSSGRQFHETGQGAPSPDCGAACVNDRFSAGSQSAEQLDHAPEQSMLRGHWPSPCLHFREIGHGEPLPAGATVSIQVRLSAGSHRAVQFDQAPSQSVCRGHPPSPGRQLITAGQGAPSPKVAWILLKLRAEARSHLSVHGDHSPMQS